MVNIKITNDNNERFEFILSGVDVAFANMIRRVMINEIPILAIDFIEIKHNTSYKSETLAHVCGLIPIDSSEENSLTIYCDNCQSFCNKCSLPITLDIKNTTDKIRKVTSSDFTKSKIKLRPKMPIIKLKKDQFITIKAHVRKNVGKKHAKWQPVSVASYNYTKPHATIFEFFIEPTGALQSREILKRALTVISDKCQKLITKL